VTIAIAKDDKDKLVDLLWNDIGTKGKYGKKDIAYRYGREEGRKRREKGKYGKKDVAYRYGEGGGREEGGGIPSCSFWSAFLSAFSFPISAWSCATFSLILVCSLSSCWS
jgi:hypothetical protein